MTGKLAKHAFDIGARDNLAAPAPGALRVLMSSYRSNPFCGGQGVYLKQLSKALVDLGHAVDVVSGPPYPDLDARVGLIKLPSLDLYARKKPLTSVRCGDLTSATNLYEWYAHNTGRFPEPYTFGRRFQKFIGAYAGDYDVLHDNQTLSWGVLSALRHGLPLVATMHHPITIDRALALQHAEGFWLRQLIRRWHAFLPMQMKAARRIENLISISDASIRDFVDAFGIERSRFEKIYPGVDLDTYAPDAAVERETDRLICTASADVPLKGLSYLIGAFAQLASTRPSLKLTVIGQLRDGPTKRAIERFNIEDRVEFVSGVSDNELAALLRRATIAVAPSLYEGFGLPAAEAMACATPVIATNGGALPEVVGDAGVVVPAQDADALAAAIAGLLDDPDRRAALGAAGRQRAAKKFTWARCAAETAAVYRHTIENAHNRHRLATA